MPRPNESLPFGFSWSRLVGVDGCRQETVVSSACSLHPLACEEAVENVQEKKQSGFASKQLLQLSSFLQSLRPICTTG